jgi:hypothetical protein
MNQVFLDFVQLYAIIIIFTRESGGATGGDYHLRRRRASTTPSKPSRHSYWSETS